MARTVRPCQESQWKERAWRGMEILAKARAGIAMEGTARKGYGKDMV